MVKRGWALCREEMPVATCGRVRARRPKRWIGLGGYDVPRRDVGLVGLVLAELRFDTEGKRRRL